MAHSTVTLVDLVQQKVSWTRRMAPPDATANVYVVACRFHGDSVYALAMANNAGRVHVVKYGRNGDELGHAAIPVPTESRVAIDMLEHDGKLHVIGFGKDTDASNEYYSMFVGPRRASSARRISPVSRPTKPVSATARPRTSGRRSGSRKTVRARIPWAVSP